MNFENKQIVKDISFYVSHGHSIKESFSLVASEYDITTASVRGLYYRHKERSLKTHANQKLTDDQENTLKVVLLSFSTSFLSLNPKYTKNLVFSLFRTNITHKWSKRFVNKQSQSLSLRQTKAFAKKRGGDDVFDEILSFCESLEAGTMRMKYSANNVLNYDETRIVVSCNGTLRIGARSSEQQNQLHIGYKTLATLLTFVGANGRIFLSVYILPTKQMNNKKEGELYPLVTKKRIYTRSNIRRIYSYTKSGFLNKELFGQIMEEFCKLWATENPNFHCFMLGDQLASHKDPVVIRKCIESGVFLWFLPANTSHFLQPLENLCFAQLKKLLASEFDEVNFLYFLTDINLEESLFEAIYDAEHVAFTKETICQSFRNTGIFPFDPIKIRHFAEIYCKGVDSEGILDANETNQRISSFINLLSKKRKRYQVERGYHNPSKSNNFMHDPTELIRNFDLKQQQLEEQNNQKKIQKQHKEQERIAKEEYKILNTCLEKDCSSVRRENTKWETCMKCNGKFCFKHKKNIKAHMNCGVSIYIYAGKNSNTQLG